MTTAIDMYPHMTMDESIAHVYNEFAAINDSLQVIMQRSDALIRFMNGKGIYDESIMDMNIHDNRLVRDFLSFTFAWK